MKRVQTVAVLTIGLTAAGCAGGIQIAADSRPQRLRDGGSAWIHELRGRGRPESAQVRALVAYLGGSNGSVLGAMGPMAGFVRMGMRVVLLERRGIAPDGATDAAALLVSADRDTRIADALEQMDAISMDLPAGVPLLLVGTSEGADIAAEVAARHPRVSHLILLGGGGGMSQADELRLLVRRDPEAYGIGGEHALEKAFEAIRASPDAETEWLGQPYRRWSSYLWSPPTQALLGLSIPLFVAHGDADDSVPVESARALRDAFARAGKNNLRYVELQGVNHQFHDASGQSRLPVVEIELLAWLSGLGILSAEEFERYQRAVRAAHPDLFH